MTARIRWNDTSPLVKAGRGGPFSFTILKMGTGPGWMLTAELPGLGRRNSRSDDLGDLKAEAERWLEEFVSSLGAVFEPDPRWAALGDWLAGQIQQDIAAERAAFADGLAYVEAAHSTRASACRSVLAKMRELEAGQ